MIRGIILPTQGRRRLLNQSTHFKVSHSTASAVFHGPIGWMTSALNNGRGPWPQWGRESPWNDDGFRQGVLRIQMISQII
ncbi:hypothetical protein TRN7648_04258 [Tropicibacter naphthalenivorans]|uniref:Uncharacterized protein n=1 Tax=Tropicibacter naphthalenivorans TaxID=441103 RepID=A0A0P1GKZ6_9RHOB|nr:hypothetical protein TRN7648_04258 [Tropicibacter naphthalenivorans]